MLASNYSTYASKDDIYDYLRENITEVKDGLKKAPVQSF
jgi:hypothetical protein